MKSLEKGSIEAGVRESMADIGIKEPRTARELLAIELAHRLDSGVDDRSLAGITAQLLKVLDEVEMQPRKNSESKVDRLIESQ